MSQYATLSLDLNSVTEPQRKLFYDALIAEKWTKLKPTTTLWSAPFVDSMTEEEVIQLTKQDLTNAAKASKVVSYDATVSVGTKPVSWKVPSPAK